MRARAHTYTLISGHCPLNLRMFVRCLSTVEAGLAKQREELSNAQIPKQEVLRDTADGVTSHAQKTNMRKSDNKVW